MTPQFQPSSRGCSPSCDASRCLHAWQLPQDAGRAALSWFRPEPPDGCGKSFRPGVRVRARAREGLPLGPQRSRGRTRIKNPHAIRIVARSTMRELR